MKLSIYWLFTMLGCWLTSFSKPPLTHINLGYKAVMRCNGIFATDNDEYWNQFYVFGRDTVGNYGQIRWKGQKENLTLPIQTRMGKKRKKGEGWLEVYGNDSIQLSLKGTPIPQQIMNTFSYDVAVEMVYKGDTLKDTWIGHCKF